MRCDLATLTHAALLTAILVGGSHTALAQSPSPDPRDQQRVDDLNQKLDRLSRQLEQSLAEIQALRSEIQALRQPSSYPAPPSQPQTSQSEEHASGIDALREQVAAIRDQNDVLQAEVKQHDQTKIETASKYPVRIGGTLLLTSFLNSGNADDFTLPTVALPRQAQSPPGSFAITASQTLMQLDLRGPHLGNAVTRGDISIDFWGSGSAGSYYAANTGSVRLRTLHAGIEGDNQALRVSLDRPLFSPTVPTSWLTVAKPALAWSGNLWAWLPQVEYARYLLPQHRLDLQVGLIDTAAPAIYRPTGQPSPNASERSRQPGYQARISTHPHWADRQVTLGASGYYSRKSYSATAHVDAWAAAADWDIPFTRFTALSGQFYRGRAIGGLGGSAFKDYVTSYGAPYGLNAAGGWAQFKLTASPTLQANLSYGIDNAYARDLADADTTSTAITDYTNLAANQTALGNLIYRPRSYLLLSAEFRRIASRSITGQTSTDSVLGIATGVTF